MKVWVARALEWEDQGILGVFDTCETAIKAIKEKYQPPYVVHWVEEEYGLTGHFDEVAHYSIEHTEYFDFEEYSVEVG